MVNIKYYKAELDGKFYLRQSANDYTVAMVHEGEHGRSVISFNSKELSKSVALSKIYGNGIHGINQKCIWRCKQYDTEVWCQEQRQKYAKAKSYSIPAIQITKDEYLQLKEGK
tara:strand:- start:155 stop:493 length:339 start_codon:yes stop_codon:yes gene_type:complete